MRQALTILTIMLSVAVAMTGCKSSKIDRSERSSVKDSVSVIKEYSVDTVYLPGDSIEVEVLIECDSLTNKPKPIKRQIVKSQLHASIAIDTSGILQVKCKTDSLIQIINKQKITMERYKTKHFEEHIESLTKRSNEARVKWYYWVVFGFALGIITILIIKIILR